MKNELTGRYAKLRDDLIDAVAAGIAAEEKNPDDGGSMNFDSAAIRLPRWNSEKVEQAAREAGIGCWKWNLYGTVMFVFGPKTKSHANARSRNAEAMTRYLKGIGYDAMDYCQAD